MTQRRHRRALEKSPIMLTIGLFPATRRIKKAHQTTKPNLSKDRDGKPRVLASSEKPWTTPRRTQDRRAIEFNVRLLTKYRDADHGVTTSTGIQGRKTMKIKNISVGIAGVILFVAAGLPQTAVAKDVEMDLRFAGAFISSGLPSPLIHVQAKGSPGKAVIRGYGAGPGDISFPTVCLGLSSDQPFSILRVEATEDPLIFTFQDLSLLFADGSGEICVDTATGNAEFRFDITFIGGRGRFEGATGTAVITGEAVPVSADGSFLAETGTIVGTIILP